MIEGSVENCVLFRGVRIGKDAVVKNSVLMQGTHVGEKCNIERVIADKNVDISSDKVLTGSDDFPLYLSKTENLRKIDCIKRLMREKHCLAESSSASILYDTPIATNIRRG